uniref:Uncharacterized protein n=1 Tax=Steinernema glaseri TaxID=37863 RepID=A0A1I7ZZM5_9BILA
MAYVIISKIKAHHMRKGPTLKYTRDMLLKRGENFLTQHKCGEFGDSPKKWLLWSLALVSSLAVIAFLVLSLYNIGWTYSYKNRGTHPKQWWEILLLVLSVVVLIVFGLIFSLNSAICFLLFIPYYRILRKEVREVELREQEEEEAEQGKEHSDAPTRSRKSTETPFEEWEGIIL